MPTPSILKRIRHFLHPVRRAYVSCVSWVESLDIRLTVGRKVWRILKTKIGVHVGKTKFRMVLTGAVAEEIWREGAFEPFETAFVAENIPKQGVFIDAGANTGYFSLLASRLSPDLRIYAFEPTGSTFSILKRNIALNGCGNIYPMQLALGAEPATALLSVNVYGKDGLNTIGTPTHAGCEILGTEQVTVVTLDDFAVQERIDHVDFIKIDTEGYELFILQGATRLLSSTPAPIIMFEYEEWTRGHGYEREEILEFLTRYGYAFNRINSATLVATKGAASSG